jgi:serine protease Do
MASNVVDNVIDQLKEFGETRRGWLGVRIQDVTEVGGNPGQPV